MTRAIILSAGQGRRLLPLTENLPKCLLPLGDRTILERQLDVLREAGIKHTTVVTGFHPELVEALVAKRSNVETCFNPFFDVSDNLASCWIARGAMEGDFLLLNGDTVFETAVLERLLASPAAPITVTIDHKPSYDEDDMKVQLDGTRVVHVSKTLESSRVHAESIGLLYFRGEGPQLFRSALEESMRHTSGLRSWYLSVIDALAAGRIVQGCAIAGCRWAEIDFAADLKRAEAIFTPSAEGDGVPARAEETPG